MHYSRVKSAVLSGLDVVEIDVEADINTRSIVQDWEIVGLGDTAVKESRKRVMSALKNSGFGIPHGKITINLAPGDVKKEGALLDLPIAMVILMAAGKIKDEEELFLIGELGLDGTLRKVNGALPIMLEKDPQEKAIVPFENSMELSLVNISNVYAATSLLDAVKIVEGPQDFALSKIVRKISLKNENYLNVDFSEVHGQETVKRALEIAAAGFHNVLMKGPPGSGKTMLARRLPTIMPPMSEKEIIESTKIYSAAGMLDGNPITQRPFRSPHHSASTASIIGGGAKAKPGEVTLAHNGVLFMDEMPEFKRDVLEALRQPLEDGVVTVSRVKESHTYPARFLLIGAQNPCPCGWYGVEDGVHHCTCSFNEIVRYNKKISGPIADRMDIFVDVPHVDYAKYASMSDAEPSKEIFERVYDAFQIQMKRANKQNGKLSAKEVRKFCTLGDAEEEFFKTAAKKLGLSGRTMEKTLKVARTIADLAAEEKISTAHLAEALQYRKKEEIFV